MFKMYLQDDINEENGSLYIQLIKLCQILISVSLIQELRINKLHYYSNIKKDWGKISTDIMAN